MSRLHSLFGPCILVDFLTNRSLSGLCARESRARRVAVAIRGLSYSDLPIGKDGAALCASSGASAHRRGEIVAHLRGSAARADLLLLLLLLLLFDACPTLSFSELTRLTDDQRLLQHGANPFVGATCAWDESSFTLLHQLLSPSEQVRNAAPAAVIIDPPTPTHPSRDERRSLSPSDTTHTEQTPQRGPTANESSPASALAAGRSGEKQQRDGHISASH
jgi:hypothetical protein